MKAVILIFIMSFTLVGCTSGSHWYTSGGTCITCINNPITGEAWNHDGEIETIHDKKVQETSEVNNSKYVTHKIFVGWPVDIAYAFLRQKLKFRNREEIKDEYKDYANMVYSANFYKHEVYPGAAYYLRDSISLFPGEPSSIMAANIEYVNPNKSSIVLTMDSEKVNPDTIIRYITTAFTQKETGVNSMRISR